MKSFEPNKHVESPCHLTGEWAFAGVLENGTYIPIGVFSSYRLGKASANAWMQSTPKAVKWMGEPLYVSLDTETADSVADCPFTCHNGVEEEIEA